MKTCPSCGAALENESAVVCPSCGASLSAGGSRFARRSRVSRPERPERPARPVRPATAAPASPEAPVRPAAPESAPVPPVEQPAAPAAVEAAQPAAPQAPAAEPARPRFARSSRAAAPSAPVPPVEQPAAPAAVEAAPPAAPQAPAAEPAQTRFARSRRAAPAPEAASRPAAPAQPAPPAAAPAAPEGPSLAESGQPARIVITPEEQQARAAEGKKRLLVGLVIAAVVVVVVLVVGLVSGLKDKQSDAPAATSAPAAQTSPSDGAEPTAQSAEGQAPEAASDGDDFEWEATAQSPVEENVPSAVASDSEVVFRNAKPGAAIFVDGAQVTFTYVGSDAVVSRDALPDVCQVRIVAPTDGGYETAAVWYNFRYGNDMTFGDDYGDYVPCDETGLGEPGAKVVDVLTWAYYSGFLRCINDQTLDGMLYSTDSNTVAQAASIFSDANSKNLFDTDNFQAVCDPESIQYKNGRVRYNATFTTNRTNRVTGEESTGTNHRTIELVWEDGVWKVNRTALLSEEDFAARRYAELP